jgi:hypothetical protein
MFASLAQQKLMQNPDAVRRVATVSTPYTFDLTWFWLIPTPLRFRDRQLFCLEK